MEFEENSESSNNDRHLTSQDDGKHSVLFPKVTNEQILAYFDGNQENLNYFLSLKAALWKDRRHGQTACFCDPEAKRTVERLKKSNWVPKVLLKPVQNEMAGATFPSKQTAHDDQIHGEGHGEGINIDSSVKEVEHIDADVETRLKADQVHTNSDRFVCGIQGCHWEFSSLASYESHYHTSHNFVCSICRRVFVSDFLLDIHLQENHDSYFQILSPRLDMYRCLVESCDSKFRTPDLRKDHLVSTHKFPASFAFHRPLKQKNKKKKKPNHQARPDSNTKMDTTCTASSNPVKPFPQSAMEVDVETFKKEEKTQRGRQQKNGRGRHEAKWRAPQAICFGRGSQKAFNPSFKGGGGYWHQSKRDGVNTKVDIEDVDLTDMMDSLDG